MNELDYKNLIFFDLETSGLDFNKHEIIQISAIDAATGDTFNELVDFDIERATEEALEGNHFDEELWNEKALPQDEAAEKFADFLRKHASLEFESKKGKKYKLAVLAGYNVVGFDKFFISNFFSKLKIFMPADYRMFDIYQLALWKYPGLQKYSLGDICNHIGIETGELHDALEDVRATMKVARAILSEPLVFAPINWSE